jgi:hypothetical protein
MSFSVLIDVVPSTRFVDTGHDTEVMNPGYGGVVGSVFSVVTVSFSKRVRRGGLG